MAGDVNLSNFRRTVGRIDSPEVSLENCEEDGSLTHEESRKEDSSITKLAETEDDHQKAAEELIFSLIKEIVDFLQDDNRKAVEELIFSLKKEIVDFLQDDNQKAVEELILLLEKETEPVDFLHVLDPSKIKLVDGKYSEGSEFIKTGELGKGNIVGPVFKVEDLQTHKEHCLKTVKKSCFKIEELKCMVDLRHTCFVPLLYMFRYRDVAVDLHMEMLTNSFTMRQIIEEKVWKLGNLREPFSFYILYKMLKAVSVMQKKTWLHNDLHDENVLIQLSGSGSLDVKLIDFGYASKIQNPEIKDSRLDNEIDSVLIIFFDALGQISFNDVDDMKKRECLDENEKKEVLDLVDFARTTKNPFQSKELLDRVEEQFNKSLRDLRMEKPEFLEQVVAVLSTGKSDDEATVREEEDDINSLEGKMAVLHGEDTDTNIENIKFPEEGNGSAPQGFLPEPPRQQELRGRYRPHVVFYMDPQRAAHVQLSGILQQQPMWYPHRQTFMGHICEPYGFNMGNLYYPHWTHPYYMGPCMYNATA